MGLSGARLAGKLASRVFSYMNEPAIQNLDFLRELIAATRDSEYADMAKLRMLQGTGMGTDALSTQQEDR